MLGRRLNAPEDPVEKVGVGAVKQRFEAIELTVVEPCKADIGERPEEKITLLCPPVPASKKESPATDVGAILAQRLIGFAMVGHELPPLCRYSCSSCANRG